jgi:CheY-like chemotaxis protein
MPSPILIVDDDVLIADLAASALRNEGYGVVIATTAESALETLTVHLDAAALVTDIQLPAMQGWELARRARAILPYLPVVYMSGDSAEHWRDEGVSGSIMLRKPFGPAALVEAIRFLLAHVPRPRAPTSMDKHA